MKNGLVWSPDSIMDLTKDTFFSSNGSAVLNNGSLVLGANSNAVFSYTFDTTDNILESDQLNFILQVINSDNTVNSRYDESVQVEAYIQYYEETVDEQGNVSGYILGGNDTYQINPYFRHEVDGYIDSYEIDINKSKVANILVYFINNSENQVTFVSPKLFNSLEIMEAITTYGGGSGGGGDIPTDPDTPTLIESLMLYNPDGKYMIDTMDGELLLETVLSTEDLINYADNNNHQTIMWTFTKVSGTPEVGITQYTYMSVDVGNTSYTIYDYKRKLTARGNGVVKVRVELETNPTIYAERTITIINNNIIDMDLDIETESGSLEGNVATNCTLKLLPENNKTGESPHDDIKITVTSYDGIGEAYIANSVGGLVSEEEYSISGGVVNFVMYGKTNGKVKVTAEIINVVNTHLNMLNPVGFKKEFIVDVAGIPPVLPVYIDTPGGIVIDETMDNLQLYVTSNDERLYYSYSSKSLFGIESVDGQGDAIVVSNSTSYGKILTYTIYPLKPGKVKFWINVETYTTSTIYYLEQEIEIKAIKRLPEIPLIETNTGLFEITTGGGQLEVYPRPNYDWHGGFSFSQVSIDGGSVTISDKGDYALITGDKNGKLNLICKPVNGPQVQCEISVSNQYPEDVALVSGSGEFKIALGGAITVYAEPGNIPNVNYDKYTWTGDYIDSTTKATFTRNNKYVTITGTGLGRLGLNCSRQLDSKLVAYQVIEIVESL
jgi:hypothetical protein